MWPLKWHDSNFLRNYVLHVKQDNNVLRVSTLGLESCLPALLGAWFHHWTGWSRFLCVCSWQSSVGHPSPVPPAHRGPPASRCCTANRKPNTLVYRLCSLWFCSWKKVRISKIKMLSKLNICVLMENYLAKLPRISIPLFAKVMW